MIVKPSYLLVALLAVGCCKGPPATAVRFCDRSEYESAINRVLGRHHIDIDIARGRISGSDVSDSVQIVDTKNYFGLDGPLPLLIPRLGVNTGDTIQINHENLALKFKRSTPTSDEFVGYMSRISPQGKATPILEYEYTQDQGVYAIIRRSDSLNPRYIQVLRYCGGAKLYPQN